MDALLEEQLAKEMEAMLLGESSLQRHPQAQPANISNTSEDSPTTKAPRLTRKDVSKLPRAIRKTHTEEELETLFNDEGYLSPQLQALIDADVASPSCYVCQLPSKDRCAGCNMVFYCSRSCQKSHWKKHKPTCRLAQNPMKYSTADAEQAVATNPDFANIMRISIDMRHKGKIFQSTHAMLKYWFQDGLEFCPYGGSLSLDLSQSGEHLFMLDRTMTRNNRLEILQEMVSRQGKMPRPADRISLPEEAQSDIARYIAGITEKAIHGLTPPLLVINAQFWIVSPKSPHFGTGNTVLQIIKRGAEVTYLGGTRWKILQFEPELLRQCDEFAAPGNNTFSQYFW